MAKEKNNNQTKDKDKITPNTYNKVLGVGQIIAIPALFVLAIIGQIIVFFIELIKSKFKEPKECAAELKNNLLNLFTKNFFLDIYHNGMFMYEYGVHYEHRNQFLKENPELVKEKQEKAKKKKPLFSIGKKPKQENEKDL